MPLPNLTQISIEITCQYNYQLEKFKQFVKTILQNCEYLQDFIVFEVTSAPLIAEYIKDSFPEHCVFCTYGNVATILPMKMAFSPMLSFLSNFAFPEKIQYLQIAINGFDTPFDDGWNNYKTIFALVPNLKGVSLVQEPFKTFGWI
jgi:hypothetical protein